MLRSAASSQNGAFGLAATPCKFVCAETANELTIFQVL